MIAIVCAVVEIKKHQNADNLEIITLSWPNPPFESHITHVVTGPHYRIGQGGVYVPPGRKIPGYLAEDAWLIARGKSYNWYEVITKNMRGVQSPGLFFGQFYEKDTRDRPTFKDLRAEERAAFQSPLPDDHPLPTPVYEWRYWRNHWKLGENVSAYLGIM